MKILNIFLILFMILTTPSSLSRSEEIMKEYSYTVTIKLTNIRNVPTVLAKNQEDAEKNVRMELWSIVQSASDFDFKNTKITVKEIKG
jgi:hypothetical protein